MSYKFSTGSVRRGDVFYEDDRTGEPTYIDFGQDTITLRPSGSQILHAQPDAVGIGTTSPSEILTLNATDPTIRFEEGGTIKATIGVNSSDNILIENKTMNKHIVFKANDQGVVREGLRLDGAVPEVVVNQQHGISGDDSLIDFRVESETSTHMLFVSGGSDRVGIGTDTPDHTLSVAGDISASVNISASAFYGDGSNLTGIGGGGGGSGPAGANTEIQFNDGGANFGASSNLTYDGTTLKVSSTGLNPIFTLETTEDGGNVSPIMTLKRNSSSPADADYLGQLRFLGENDANQEVIYAKITGKISDATDGTEDGIIEFANIRAGSQTIAARLKSDSLQLLNSTGLTVDGDVGIGTTSPLTTLHVHSDLANEGAVTISQADDSGDASQLDLSKARGTGASPTTVQNNDFIGQIRTLGYDGDSYDNFADIYVQAAGTISTTSHPSKMVIRTTKASATSPTTAVTIDQNQNMTVNGNIYGRMLHMTHHRYNDGSGTGKEYIPWAGTSEQPSPSWITQGVAPYEGKLLKVLIRSSKSGGMGSTVVGIHTNVDGNTVINSTAEETETVNMTTANTTYTFTFSNVTHFGHGDIIGVSIDPTNAHGNVNVTCVWEYDITQ